VFLKLTRRRAYAGAAEALASSPREMAANEYDSPSVKRVLGRIECGRARCVLDLGVVTGETITAFAEAGAVVHAYDVVTPWLAQMDDDKADVLGLLNAIPTPDAVVDVVCVWELFDLLTQAQAEAALAWVASVLRPKGLILAAFNVSSVSHVHRFRLSASGRVVLDEAGELEAPLPVATNNEVARLFSGYSLLHSALVRGKVREVLAQSG